MDDCSKLFFGIRQIANEALIKIHKISNEIVTHKRLLAFEQCVNQMPEANSLLEILVELRTSLFLLELIGGGVILDDLHKGWLSNCSQARKLGTDNLVDQALLVSVHALTWSSDIEKVI